MEPRIQYAKTADGVSIAFWTLGEGLPLLYMPPMPYSHIEMEWQAREWRRWYERLAEKRMLIRYDGRGSGVSERDVTDFSLDVHVRDLEAVVDCLDLDRFALFAMGNLGPPAIAYASRHPERVSHLVLWAAWARGSDFWRSSRTQAFTALREKDWELYTETAGHWLVGWDPDLARQFAAFIRESITPEAHQALMDSAREFDVTALLSEVRSPTLVLHRRELSVPDVALARGLASCIPDARLALLEGESIAPWLGDTEAVLAAMDEFLGEGEEATAVAEVLEAGAFRTVLFTDVEGSTALTQRLGDAKARDLLREHERMVREALKAHGGSE